MPLVVDMTLLTSSDYLEWVFRSTMLQLRQARLVDRFALARATSMLTWQPW